MVIRHFLRFLRARPRRLHNDDEGKNSCCVAENCIVWVYFFHVTGIKKTKKSFLLMKKQSVLLSFSIVP